MSENSFAPQDVKKLICAAGCQKTHLRHRMSEKSFAPPDVRKLFYAA
jgi:hypothetical protein